MDLFILLAIGILFGSGLSLAGDVNPYKAVVGVLAMIAAILIALIAFQ